MNGGVDLIEEADLDRGAAHLQDERQVLPDLRRGRHRGSTLRGRVSERLGVRPVRAIQGQSDSHAAAARRVAPFPITTTGHADFVQTQNGEWWAVFLGASPYARDTYNTGRETFMLPVQWRDGWPIILEGNATVPWSVKRPHLPRQAASTPQPTAARLARTSSIEMISTARRFATSGKMIRTPRSQWYDLTSSPGWLTIKARSEKLGELGQPSFLGRRQQHLTASASVAMRYTPEKPGDEAGITAFQNDDHFYLIAVVE